MKRQVVYGRALLAPEAVATAHDGDEGGNGLKKKNLAIILLIVLAVLAALAALLYKEYSRKAKTSCKGSPKASHKLVDLGAKSKEESPILVNGKSLVPPIVDQEQAKLSILASKESRTHNDQQAHATPVSLDNHPPQSLMIDSRNLTNLREGWPLFNMDHLLKSSAEPLHGMGVFGTTYKVTQKGLPTIVLKHLQNVSIGHQAFKNRIEDLAKINHVNVLPIVAYYFSDTEKVLLYEYISSGNLSTHLHGKGKEGWSPLEWPKRAQIAMDVARGIAYIHGKGRNKGLVHGNIKPGNVLLRGLLAQEGSTRACLTDIGLAHLLRACPPTLNLGYRAPEVVAHSSRPLTHKSDVYSFGVLLLELLTAKKPFSGPPSNQILDLPRLIHSSIHEEWTAEIFDPHIPHRFQYEEEMVLMLKIAMECVQAAPRERPSMFKVLGMLKVVRDFDDLSGSTYTDISTPRDHDHQEFV